MLVKTVISFNVLVFIREIRFRHWIILTLIFYARYWLDIYKIPYRMKKYSIRSGIFVFHNIPHVCASESLWEHVFAQEKAQFIYANVSNLPNPEILFFNFPRGRCSLVTESTFSRFRYYLPHISAGHLNCNTWFSQRWPLLATAAPIRLWRQASFRSALAYSIPGLFVCRAARLTRTKEAFKGLTIITCSWSRSFTSAIALATYKRVSCAYATPTCIMHNV